MMQVIFVNSETGHKILFHTSCKRHTSVSQLYQWAQNKGHLASQDELYFYLVRLARDDLKTTLSELLNDRQNVLKHKQLDVCKCKLSSPTTNTVLNSPSTITLVVRKADSDENFSVFAYDWLSKLNLMLKKLAVLNVLFRH